MLLTDASNYKIFAKEVGGTCELTLLANGNFHLLTAKTVNIIIMNLDDIKNYISKISNIDLSNKAKIFATISLSWIIFIGYLTWWNGLKSLALDKSFRWDEWFWFGIVPALVPYIFYFIWRKKDE